MNRLLNKVIVGYEDTLREALLKDHVGVPLDRVDHRRVLLAIIHRQAD